MGNLAQKCWPKTGQVRVVLINGDYKEFKQPVTVANVLEKFPNHLVIHCSVDRSLNDGQRRRIRIMKPYQELKVKQDYVLMPSGSMEGSKSFTDSWVFFALNACQVKLKSSVKERRDRYPRSPSRRTPCFLRVFEKISRSCVKPSQSSLLKGDETQPFLQSNQSSVLSTPSTASAPLRTRRQKSVLERIPESPLQSPFHRFSFP